MSGSRAAVTLTPPAPLSQRTGEGGEAGKLANAELAIEYDPRLVEEAVLLALAGDIRESAFRFERDVVYDVYDPDSRERRFADLHAKWFARLGLDEPLRAALSEQPLVLAGVCRCVCRRARRRKDEGAELFVDTLHRDRLPVLAFTLLPDSFLDEEFPCFVRHELQHVADMLDPAFAYVPSLPKAEAGPSHDRRLADRYRVLWDTYIDGRLVRGGRLFAHARERRRREFAAAFGAAPEQAEAAFAYFFEAAGPLTHADLVRFAYGEANAESAARCALCHCPTCDFEPQPLEDTLVVLVRERFAHWTAAEPICRQCADLYRARRYAAAAGAGPAAEAVLVSNDTAPSPSTSEGRGERSWNYAR